MADIDLRSTLGAVVIERDVVHVHGPDAIDFLQGQLSQDVEALPVGSSTRALLLQPTGKVVAWLRATRTADDAVLLDVEAGFGEAVRARLARFKLRTKAELEVETRSGYAVRGPGADALAPPGALPAGWPGVEGFDVLDGPPPPGVPLAAASSLEALRIEAGVPSMGAELTEATIPAEAGQWLIDASVSFTKGCFTGQELVARIDSRGGNVPRPLRGLLVDGEVAPPGTTVTVGDTDVGVVTSSAHSLDLGAVALAPLARSVTPGTMVVLRRPDGTVADATTAALPCGDEAAARAGVAPLVSHYDVLGVAPTAPTAEVRRAYVALARRYHPDRTGGDATRMRAVNEAWATLRDPGRRALYDVSLRGGPRLPPAAPEPPDERRDDDDLLADLADDTPLGGRVVLPRWLSLLPVAVFAASVALFCAGLMFASAPALALAMASFVLSCTMFLAAPFVALLTSRRSTAGSRQPRER